MLQEATKLLLDSQNVDGGWGGVHGNRSTTEATSLAFLALCSREQTALDPAIQRAEKWLVERQNADGSWPMAEGLKGPSWSTAFAMLALSESTESTERVIRAGRWALEQEGSKIGLLAKLVLALQFQKRAVHLNEDLIGWSWTPDTFSWVEPTSYFLIALKKLKRRLPPKAFQERVPQGELMIYDRMCENGGWNYGNSSVYGERLWPYPDVTAVALIALQDHRERKENQMSLQALDEMAKNTGSGLALGWTTLCYVLYGKDGAALKSLLEQRFGKTKFLGETKAIALGILALGNGARYFRI
jgi:hypothetical protein